jgi:ribonuclease P protein component
MQSRKCTFPKNERLCWKRHIDLLFQKGSSFVAFPLRVIYLPIDKDVLDAEVSMLVSVPKKKIKHAVDRNVIKRRVRESYRIRKHALIDLFAEKDKKLLLAFLFLDKEKASFDKIDRAMSKAMLNLQKKPE